MSDRPGHIVNPYLFVLLALLALTGVTYGVALVDFGHPWSDLAALAIALVKVSLVLFFFMHVRGSTALIKIAAISGFFWMAIFFAIVLTDYLTRVIVYDLP